MSTFSGIVTPQSVAFNGPSGKMYNVTDAHPNFAQLRETMKELQAARKAGDEDAVAEIWEKLVTLAEPAKQIIAAGQGRVTVQNGVVFYAGQPIHNAVTDRILWGIREGFDMDPYVKFLDNLMDNPSKRAVDELYGFLEKNGMGITDDGCLIAYKRVRDDYLDIHSAKFDNSPGQILEMPRNQVDDDKNRTCSYGFHFCSQSYLPHFGAGPGSRIVIVKVNPRDVVSIPADYNAAKARACRYEVIGEYEGSDKDDILGTKAVWSDSDWRSYDDGDDADGWIDDEDGEFWEDDFGDQDVLDDQEADADECLRVGEGVAITEVEYDFDEGVLYNATVTWADGEVTDLYDDDEFEKLIEVLHAEAVRENAEFDARRAAEAASVAPPSPPAPPALTATYQPYQYPSFRGSSITISPSGDIVIRQGNPGDEA